MITISEDAISEELQELYLQNKEWMSQVLFLEDEGRFFQKLFSQRLFKIARECSAETVDLIRDSLESLERRTMALKSLVLQHQCLLENILSGGQVIGVGLIEEHATITMKIQELFYAERLLKSGLFELVEGLKL
ncbi:MAG: hypothetical protein V4687_07730 [Bacteroidota bacterium]